MSFRRPRGTRDFLPGEMELRRMLESRICGIFRSFGYREVGTPTFEHLELITAKSGEEIVERLYSFQDKSGRWLALRPEFTAPVMRMYVTSLQSEPKPLRLYYFGPCFRYERPQAGRYREFWQAGVELIGSGTPEAQAEVVALADTVLRELELEYELHVGSVGVLRKLLAEHGAGEEEQVRVMGMIDRGEVEEALQRLEALGGAELAELVEQLITLEGEAREVARRAERVLEGHSGATGELRSLGEIMEALEWYGVEARLNLGIARGLDYYTGMVFEAYVPSLGAEKQVCGGGSYSLAEVFGGKPVPTSGFAFGFDRLLIAAELEPPVERRVMVIPMSREMVPGAVRVASELRGRGVRCELEVMGRKLGKALAGANAKGVEYVVLVGEELRRGRVVLRDMRTGEQREVEVERLGELPELSQPSSP